MPHDGQVQISLGSSRALLYLLASRGSRIVNREEILDTIWGVDLAAESDIVPALHRHRPGRGLPLHPDLLEPGLGGRADTGDARQLIVGRPPEMGH